MYATNQLKDKCHEYNVPLCGLKMNIAKTKVMVVDISTLRQGDTSPKLFTASSESILRRLKWENKGVNIDGEFLSNLRFPDAIFLCTETPQELQHMLQELSDESRRMGLKITSQRQR